MIKTRAVKSRARALLVGVKRVCERVRRREKKMDIVHIHHGRSYIVFFFILFCYSFFFKRRFRSFRYNESDRYRELPVAAAENAPVRFLYYMTLVVDVVVRRLKFV